MKTVIILIALALSATALSIPINQISDQLARQIAAALKNRAAEEYAELFRPLISFHATMDENSSFYGENLTAAKVEFSICYENEVLLH